MEENRHDPYAAFRHAEFRDYLIGRLASSVGSRMQSVAIGWQIYDLTNSPLALGYMGMAQAIPALSLALIGGHIADRRDRRAVLLVTQLAMVAASAGLIFSTYGFHRSVLPLYAMLFLMGIARGFQSPAYAALTPDLIPQKDYSNAYTWQTVLFQFSALAGPLLGGYILRWRYDPAHVYMVEVVLGLVAFATLFAIKPRPAPPLDEEESLMDSLTSGLRFVWRRPLILAPITLDMLAVLFGGAVALLPIFAKDILHVGPVGLGYLTAATSAGGVLMAGFMTHRPPIRRAGASLLGCVALFGVAMIGFGLSKNFYLSFFFLAMSGAVDNVSMVIRSTLIPALTPKAMWGRVSSVDNIFVGTSNEIGAFESGVTAKFLGTVPSVVLGGIMTLVVVAATALKWPELRKLGALDQVGEVDEAE
jgi:MFS family permease